jgi:hypothetical protein
VPVELIKHKNPAVDQLKDLRKQFAEYENVSIERVGSADMSSFQVWVYDTPAKSLNGKGHVSHVTVELSLDQLRTVKGNVNIGANDLTFAGVKEFLVLLGIE